MISNPYKILYFKYQIDAILSGQLPKPQMVEFFLTEKCNHNCATCLFKDYHDSKELRTKNIIETFNQLKGSTQFIEYCGGGEPTLHSDLLKIIKCGYELGFHQGLITNGSMLLKFKNQLGKYLSYIRISLDASTADLHRTIHKSNDFNNIIEGIKCLVSEKNSGLEITLKFLVMQENRYDIENFVTFAKDLGVKNIQFKAARNSCSDLTSIDELEANKLIKSLQEKYPKFIFGNLDKSKLETPWCKANLLSCFIDADGNVYICCYFQGREEKHSFGNIYKNDFWHIWDSEEHLLKVKNIDISKCNVYDCRYHQYNKVIEELQKGCLFI